MAAGWRVGSDSKPSARADSAFRSSASICCQVKAVVPKGKKQETYLARVAVGDSGTFNLKPSTATVEGINHKYCHRIQMGGGCGNRPISHFQHRIGKEPATSPA